jgi:hypothetical protein
MSEKGSPTEVRCIVRHVCFYPHFGQAADATRGPSGARKRHRSPLFDQLVGA